MYTKNCENSNITHIKDTISNSLPDGYSVFIYNDKIEIKNKSDKIVFTGNIFKNDNGGSTITGDFPLEKKISVVVSVFLIIYVVALLGSYLLRANLYDLQILLLLIALAVAILSKKVVNSKVAPLKKVFEDLK